MDLPGRAVICTENSSLIETVAYSLSSIVTSANGSISIAILPYGTPVYHGMDNLVSDTDVYIGIGYLLGFGFFGVLVAQTFIYHIRFPNDRKGTKYFVGAIQLLETLNCAVIIVAFVDGLFRTCLSCAIAPSMSSFTPLLCANELIPVSSNGHSWTFSILSVLTSLISSMVHGFFCWRIWVISRSLLVPCMVMIVSLLQCVVVIYGIIRTYSIPRSLAVDNFSVGSALLGGSTIAWGDYLWLGSSFLCDIIITAKTTELLFRRKSSSGFAKTKSLLAKLITLTIETGMVIAIATLTELIMAVMLPALYHLVIFFVLSKLYANCVMATLNARLVFSGESNRQVSTALFEHPDNAQAVFTSSLHFRHDDQSGQYHTGTTNSITNVETEPSSGSGDLISASHQVQSATANAGTQAPITRFIKPHSSSSSFSLEWSQSSSDVDS